MAIHLNPLSRAFNAMVIKSGWHYGGRVGSTPFHRYVGPNGRIALPVISHNRQIALSVFDRDGKWIGTVASIKDLP